MPSRFLPPEFDPTRPVAVIAGKGDYPVLTTAALRRAGIPVRLIGFVDETAETLVGSFPETERRILHVGQLGRMLETLRRFEAGAAIMAGQITPKRLFEGLKPDLKAATLLLRLKRRNAETIFGAIAAEITALGVRLLDARAFLDDQLADAGWMTRRVGGLDDAHLAHGIAIARECARLDIGQGVVVRKGTVLAVEAFEGTDEMLRRAGAFKTDAKIFVKTVKPAQDFRFDVPVFGIRTLETMREAGIATAALAAGDVLMLGKPDLVRSAETAGIQITGFSVGDGD